MIFFGEVPSKTPGLCFTLCTQAFHHLVPTKQAFHHEFQSPAMKKRRNLELSTPKNQIVQTKNKTANAMPCSQNGEICHICLGHMAQLSATMQPFWRVNQTKPNHPKPHQSNQSESTCELWFPTCVESKFPKVSLFWGIGGVLWVSKRLNQFRFRSQTELLQTWVSSKSTSQRVRAFLPCGCGSKPIVPFWGRCTTHFSLF